MRGAELSHHEGECSFERFLQVYALDDPALRRLGELAHEADVGDERFDAPEAPGIDLVVRALGDGRPDLELIALTDAIFDGIYATFTAG